MKQLAALLGSRLLLTLRAWASALPRNWASIPRQALAAGLLLALAVPTWAAGPYNVTDHDKDRDLMLRGHDPVAYFTVGRHVLGKRELQARHDGVNYWFATAENKTLFEQAPERYVPMFGGYCSNGIVYGIPWGGDPDTWKIIDGRLYIFGGEASRRYFVMDQARNVELAQRYWKDEVSGSTAMVQRAKRLVLRVPHYKSGAELEEQYQQVVGNARPTPPSHQPSGTPNRL